MSKQICIACLAVTLFAAGCFAYSGGTGEPNSPYQIADINDLLALAAAPADYNKCFILTADVNLQGQVFTTAIIAADTNSASGFQGTSFTGTFDGNDHKIMNFTINGGDYLGLFGRINTGGLVKNLGLENVSITGGYNSYYLGGLVGSNYDGSISNCYSTGTVSGYGYVGGLVGSNRSSISNCYSTGSVSASDRVGGLVGYNNYGSISNCYSTGSVSGHGDSGNIGGLVGGNSGTISNCYSTCAIYGSFSDFLNGSVGGLVGSNFGGSIGNCYSTGTVSGLNSQGNVGGLVGINAGTISNCYSTGIVTGRGGLGGLVGYNSSGNISNCYSTGAVSGHYDVGGLVGYSDSGTANNSFWDVNTSGHATSAGGTGKTTAEMKTLSTFANAGWDFSYTDGNEAVWFMQINEYPILVWQISPADIYTDGKNNFRDFAIFAQFWMRDDCRMYNNFCDWSDLNFDGSVDIDDLFEFMTYWLQSGIYN